MEYAGADLLDAALWFCVRTQPRREFLACGSLQRYPGDVEVFCPRIRYRRSVRGKLLSVTEPLFPGYLFACFNPVRHLRLVLHAQGVARVVSFGGRYPVLEPGVIAELRREFGGSGVREIEPLYEGQRVLVHHGPLRQFEALLTKVLPGEQRVRVLLEFLGRQMELELPISAVTPADRDRLAGRLCA
jgi:transcriptional antiterminator RfaH